MTDYVMVKRDDLLRWAEDFVRNNDPGDDTDVVTPFDGYLLAPAEAQAVAVCGERPSESFGPRFTPEEWDRLGKLPPGTKLYAAPPSAPVGVERKYPDDGNGDDDAYNRGWNACLDALAQQPAAPSGDAVASDTAYRSGYAQGVADSRSHECDCVRTVAIAAPQQPAAIPRLANCGKYTATDNNGQHYYLNHANTWQTFQGQQPAPVGVEGLVATWRNKSERLRRNPECDAVVRAMSDELARCADDLAAALAAQPEGAR